MNRNLSSLHASWTGWSDMGCTRKKKKEGGNNFKIEIIAAAEKGAKKKNTTKHATGLKIPPTYKSPQKNSIPGSREAVLVWLAGWTA